MTVHTPSFVSLILSEDQIIDPFDIKLCGKFVISDLSVNQTYHSLFECNLPFNLPGQEYFLILHANGKTVTIENKDLFKNIVTLRNVAQTVATDLVVVDVKSNSFVSTGDTLQTSWAILNNGTEEIERAYKCDTLYLSDDTKWDIDDTEVVTRCKTIYGNKPGTSMPDTVNEKLPLVKQDRFYSIVKSRSSLQEVNQANNFGVSENTTLVLHQNLTLSIETTFLITKNGLIVRIGNVPSDETLLIAAESDKRDQIIDVFVNGGDIATSNRYIAYSSRKDSRGKHHLTIPNTKNQDYYIYIRQIFSNQPSFNVKLFAKIATFEVTSIYPEQLPILIGEQVTVKIQGSLFPTRCLVSFGGDFVINATNVYRFSSTLIFATIQIPPFISEVERFYVLITDMDKGTVANSSNRDINFYGDKTGVLKLHTDIPRAVRVEENLNLQMMISNDGNTDILPPMFYFNVTDNVHIRNVGEDQLIESGGFLFLGTSFQHPAGVLPPKHILTVDFEIIPKVRGVAELPISVQRLDNKDDMPNPYIDLKSDFKPWWMSSRQWEPVWNVFLQNTGVIMKTFHKRICQTATHFSMIGTPSISVDDLVNYELLLADGIYLSNNLHTDIDLEVETDSFIPLIMKRYINPLLSFRDIPGPYNGYGPFGKTWISPFW